MGGPNISHKDCALKTARIWDDEPNHYLEPKGVHIIGVEFGNLLVPTRLHQWTIKYQPKRDDSKCGLDPSSTAHIDPSNSIHYLMDTSPLDTPLIRNSSVPEYIRVNAETQKDWIN
jgi:hypothetical protein